MNVKVLSFFGPPGSGKGTIASDCVKELGYKKLSTGDLLRKHIQEKTDLGNSVEKHIDAGELVPDELITDIVLDWLRENSKLFNEIILDGFPRTKKQAELFLNSLKLDEFSNIDFSVINFEISEEEVIRRISSRLVCSNKKCQAVYSTIASKPKQEGICDLCGSELIKRKDDKEEVVRERLKVFNRYKKDLLNFYKDSNQKIINFEVVTGLPKDVFEKFRKAVL